MCGIIGYVGEKEAYPLLLSGLERLEYRGYDSAGISTICQNRILINKLKGRVFNLRNENLPGKIGIAHNRWATHGQPSDTNAHPFTDSTNSFVLVHNGIIENYLELKEELRKDKINFVSETDSEVIVHLISKNYFHSTEAISLKEAVLKTVKKLRGSYAFCVLNKNLLEIVGARNGSPLIIGLGDHENFLASDVSAVIEHTKKVIYLDDFQIAEITKDQAKIYDFQNKEIQKEPKIVDWNLEQAQKSGYKHFMLKEIFQQPEVIRNSMNLKLNPLRLNLEKISRIIFIACGTASYAGLVGKYLIERIAKIPAINEIASEFRYKYPLISKDDLVIAISQSGETADTLAAIRLAKEKGARTLGIINVVDSTIAREVDEVIYTRAGPEIGVASTKAFTAQLAILYKLAFQLVEREFPAENLVENILRSLNKHPEIQKIAKKYSQYQNFFYIGRNLNYPLALEGALKLKEISYIHAEAYPSGELKHGPIALVSEEMPTIALCPQDELYEKNFSNIKEIKARNGKVIAIATEGDEKIKEVVDEIIFIPKVEEIFYPLILAIPLQLFAYDIADLRECDIDKPRNLAKSVTVE